MKFIICLKRYSFKGAVNLLAAYAWDLWQMTKMLLFRENLVTFDSGISLSNRIILVLWTSWEICKVGLNLITWIVAHWKYRKDTDETFNWRGMICKAIISLEMIINKNHFKNWTSKITKKKENIFITYYIMGNWNKMNIFTFRIIIFMYIY